jgi:hypothetical protein
MKDPDDDQTLDALEPPKRGRGRPRTGEAKDDAQRAREYRERRKQRLTESRAVEVVLTRQERTVLVSLLQDEQRRLIQLGSLESAAFMDALGDRLGYKLDLKREARAVSETRERKTPRPRKTPPRPDHSTQPRPGELTDAD